MNITIIVKHDHYNNKYNYQWYTIIYISKLYYNDNNYIIMKVTTVIIKIIVDIVQV